MRPPLWKANGLLVLYTHPRYSMHRLQSCYILCLHSVRRALPDAVSLQSVMTCRRELVMSVGTALQRAGPQHMPLKNITGGSLGLQRAHRKAVGRSKRRRKETRVQVDWSALQAAANHSAVRQAAWQSKRVPCSRGVLQTEVDKFCCTSTGQPNAARIIPTLRSPVCACAEANVSQIQLCKVVREHPRWRRKYLPLPYQLPLLPQSP